VRRDIHILWCEETFTSSNTAKHSHPLMRRDIHVCGFSFRIYSHERNATTTPDESVSETPRLMLGRHVSILNGRFLDFFSCQSWKTAPAWRKHT